MDLRYLIYEKSGGLARIKINRPEKLNALNQQVYREIGSVFMDCESDPDVRVIIISGNENEFAAGADVDEMVKGDVILAYELTKQSQRVQERVSDIPKPTIAAISGYALGGGLELSLCCDFRIASDNAVFGVPEINLGIIPGGGGTQRIPRLIGTARAAELILLGESIDAHTAERWGLVNRVVPRDQLEESCEALAEKLVEKPLVALRGAKHCIQIGMNMGLKEGLKIEQDIFCMLFGTLDQKEGMAAFLEKRKPVFRGK